MHDVTLILGLAAVALLASLASLLLLPWVLHDGASGPRPERPASTLSVASGRPPALPEARPARHETLSPEMVAVVMRVYG